MAMKEYPLGTLVRVSAWVRNDDDEFADPVTASFFVKSPAQIAASAPGSEYPYGSGATIRDAVGKFHLDVDANQVGIWHVRWASTGVQSAGEQQFRITSNF